MARLPPFLRGRKGGSSYKNTPDTIRSEDSVEVILAVGEGENFGLAEGAKSFRVGGTALVNSNDEANFEDFILTEYTGVPNPPPIVPVLGGFGSPTAANASSLASGTPVVRTGTLTQIDYLDLRFLIQGLSRSDDKGIYTATMNIKVEYRQSVPAGQPWQLAWANAITPGPGYDQDTTTPGRNTYTFGGSPTTSLDKLFTFEGDNLYLRNEPTPGPPVGDFTNIWVNPADSSSPSLAGRPYVWDDGTDTWIPAPGAVNNGGTWTYGTTTFHKNPSTAPENPQVGDVWAPPGSAPRRYNGSSWVVPLIGSAQNTGYAQPLQGSTNGILSMTQKVTSPTVREVRVPVPRVDVPYDIRVTKMSPDNSSDGKNVSMVGWESFEEIIAEGRSFPNTHMIHFIGKASDQFNSLPELEGDIKGRIVDVPTNYDPVTRTYAGVWDGLFKKAWTDNGAWATRDFIKNNRYGLSTLYPFEVKEANFYAWAQWCDVAVPDNKGGSRPRWTYNDVLDAPRQAKEQANYMAGSCGGRLIDDGSGIYDILVDRDEPMTMIFGPESVVDGEFVYSFTDIQTRANWIKVGFVNPDLEWQVDYRRVKDDDHIEEYGRIPLEFVATGKTNVSEALAAARLRLVTGITEYTACTFRTNRVGKYLWPFKVIGIVDPDMGWGVSGRISEQTGARQIRLRDPVYLEAGLKYKFRFNRPTSPMTTVALDVVAGQTGSLTTINLAADLPADLPEFAQFALESYTAGDVPIGLPKAFKILTITPADGDSELVELTVMELNRTKHAFVDGTGELLPAEEYTNFDGPILRPINARMTPTTATVAGAVRRNLQIEWDQPANPFVRNTIIEYSRDGNNFVEIGRSASEFFELEDVSSGTHAVRLMHIHTDGVRKSLPVTLIHEVTSEYRNIPSVADLVLADEPYPTVFESISPMFRWAHGDEDVNFKAYRVRILTPGNVVVRTEDVSIKEFIYDFDKNKLDHSGVPSRSFTIQVTKVDDFGSESPPVALSVDNPVPVAPTFTLDTTFDGFNVSVAPPSSRGVIGTLIWVSETSGFDPSATAPVYDGDQQVFSVVRPEVGQVYVRVAYYDAFGRTNLSIANEQTIRTAAQTDAIREIFRDNFGFDEDLVAAEASAAAAAAQAAAAAAAAGASQAAQANSELARDLAGDARDLAQTANAGAQSAYVAAGSSASAAETARLAAVAAQGGAEGARGGAETARDASAASAATADGHRAAAQTSATNSANSATLSSDKATAASASASVASTKADEAGVSAASAASSSVTANAAFTAAKAQAIALIPDTISAALWTNNFSTGAPETRPDGSASAFINGEYVAPTGSPAVGGPKGLVRWESGRIYELTMQVWGGTGPTAKTRFAIDRKDGSYGNIAPDYMPATAVAPGALVTITLRVGLETTPVGGVNLARNGANYIGFGVQPNINATLSGGEPDANQWVSIFKVRDVTALAAAESQASAAVIAASTATAQADLAGTRASAADTARIAAQSAQGGAEVARAGAATSETNAAGSASAASSAALVSATARDAAVTTAAALLPGDFSKNGLFWSNVLDRSPETMDIATIGGFPTDPATGVVYQVPADTCVSPKGVFVPLPNRTYEMTLDLQVAFISTPTTRPHVAQFRFLNASFGYIGDNGTMVTVPISGERVVRKITWNSGANPPPYVRPLLIPWYQGGPDGNDGLMNIRSFLVKDVTEQVNAAGSAAASSASASTASAAATSAGEQAAAASTARNQADTYAANALSYSNTAVAAASSAAGSEAAASASAGLAASAGTKSLVDNASFALGLTSGLPTKWSEWANTTGQCAIVSGGSVSPYKLRVTNPGVTDQGFNQWTRGYPNSIIPGWFVAEAAISIHNGGSNASGLDGAGLIVHFLDGSGGYVNEATILFRNEFGSVGDADGRVYRFAKLIDARSFATIRSFRLFCMNRYSGWATIAADNKALDWHEALVRPATAGEIENGVARGGFSSVGARISTEEAVRASETASLATRLTKTEAKAVSIPNKLRNSDGSQGASRNWSVVEATAEYDTNVGSFFRLVGSVNKHQISDLIQVNPNSPYNFSFEGGVHSNISPEYCSLYVSEYDASGNYISSRDGQNYTNFVNLGWFENRKTGEGWVTGPDTHYVKIVFRKLDASIGADVSRIMFCYGTSVPKWTDEATARDVYARTSIVESSVADAQAKLAVARLTLTAAATGGRPARMGLYSDSYGGSAIALDAAQIYFGDNSVFDDPSDTLQSVTGSVRYVLAWGADFGPDGLRQWMGPSSVTLSGMTRANAYFYIASTAPYVGGSALPDAGGGGGGYVEASKRLTDYAFDSTSGWQTVYSFTLQGIPSGGYMEISLNQVGAGRDGNNTSVQWRVIETTTSTVVAGPSSDHVIYNGFVADPEAAIFSGTVSQSGTVSYALQKRTMAGPGVNTAIEFYVTARQVI